MVGSELRMGRGELGLFEALYLARLNGRDAWVVRRFSAASSVNQTAASGPRGTCLKVEESHCISKSGRSYLGAEALSFKLALTLA